jgi:FkbM family methyltransferase
MLLPVWRRSRASCRVSKMQSTDVQIFDKSYKAFGYPDEGWFNILQHSGKYDEFNLENLRPLINPDSICIDCGANLGMMTLAMAALAPEGKVYAFEPDSKTFPALQKTVEASGYSNILLYPFVLGREGLSGTFVEDAQWRSSSHFVPGDGAYRMVSIDGMELQHVDFIKIDVEGGELDVLDGARETLIRCKPVVVIEFNTFAFVHYREIAPRQALKRICETFPNVCYFENRVGRLIRLDDPEAFLRKNFFNGFVDDLLCFWT